MFTCPHCQQMLENRLGTQVCPRCRKLVLGVGSVDNPPSTSNDDPLELDEDFLKELLEKFDQEDGDVENS